MPLRGRERPLQAPKQLVQLLRRQPQGKASQVVGDIFRKLLLSQLQSPAKLHGDLVALVHAQKRRQLQQGQAGAVAHRHPVAHLNKIRIMRRNVQHLSPACVGVLR